MTDKNKTIKNASDEELSRLIFRLRKERELQDIVRDLKMRSLPDREREYAHLEGISTEEPINNIYHYGVLGMKWGVRRYQPYPKGEGHKGKFIGKRESAKKAKKAAADVSRKNQSHNRNVIKKRFAGEAGKDDKLIKVSDSRKQARTASKESKASDAKSNRSVLKERLQNPKSSKKMTDEELKSAVSRLNLEKQYAQLTNEQKAKGAKAAKKVLATAGTGVAVSYTSKAMTKTIEAAIKAAIEAAKAV